MESRKITVARHYANIPQEITSSLQLRLKCGHLVSKDTKRTTVNAIAIVDREINGNWTQIGQTEILKNCNSPEFAETLAITYSFEEMQKLRFRVYDIIHPNFASKVPSEEDQLLGALECRLGQIVSCVPFVKRLPTDSYDPYGTKTTSKSTLTVFAEELAGNQKQFQFRFSAKNLDKKDVVSKSDPYMEAHKQIQDSSWTLLYRTEVKDNTLNPVWQPFTIAERLFTNNSHSNGEIKFSIWDYDNDGQHDLIGEVTTNYQVLTERTENKTTEWPIVHPKKLKQGTVKESGTLILENYKILPEYTFLDYIFGGLQICFTVAIDFSASNGNLDDPTSLHHLNPEEPNEYQLAIETLGSIIQDYDSDMSFPAFGFGAKTPLNEEDSTKFPLNMNTENAKCLGVDGVVEAYKQCLNKVQSSEPTVLLPIISSITTCAREADIQQTPTNYHVLLVVTDGAITDIEEVKEAIVQASSLPLSVIIVGVGNGDFKNLNALDSDDSKLSITNGSTCIRDIVQFVPFRQYQHAPLAIFTKQVLAEIPRQILEYYKYREMPPNPQEIKLPDEQ